MALIHTYIWVLWDILAIGVIYHRVRKCAHMGFVSTIIRLLVYIAAVIVAQMTYIKVADFLYDNVIREAIQSTLTRSFNQMLNGIGEAPDILRSIPFGLRMLIGFKKGEVAELPLTDASGMAGQVIETALRQPIMSILHGVGFLLIFTLTAYLVKFIARMFTGINRVPILGAVNAALGGVAGVVEGLIMLFVAGFVMRIIIAISGEAWWWLNSSVISSTYIWRLFY